MNNKSYPEKLYVFANNGGFQTYSFIGFEYKSIMYVYGPDDSKDEMLLYLAKPDINLIFGGKGIFRYAVHGVPSNRFKMIAQCISSAMSSYTHFITKDKEFAEMILADDAEPNTYYTVNDKYFNVCQHTLYGKIWLSVRLQNIINPIGNVNNKLFNTEKEAVAEAERMKKGDEAKKKELLALIDKAIEENEKEARIGGRLKHLRILNGTQLKTGIEYRILHHSELTVYTVRPSRMSECGRLFLTKEGYIISTLPSATYIRTNEIPLYNELRHKEALGKLVDSLKRLKHCIETLCTYKEGMENYHAIVNKIVELKKKESNEQDRANQWRCL